MNNDNMQPLIDRYRRELLEFGKKSKQPNARLAEDKPAPAARPEQPPSERPSVPSPAPAGQRPANSGSETPAAPNTAPGQTWPYFPFGLDNTDDLFDNEPIPKARPARPAVPEHAADDGALPPSGNMPIPAREMDQNGEPPVRRPIDPRDYMPGSPPAANARNGARRSAPTPAGMPRVPAQARNNAGAPTGGFRLWSEPSVPAAAVREEGRVLQTTTDETSMAPRTPSLAGGRVFLETQYKTLEEFRSANAKKGFLKVQVFSGDRTFPITNARVLVTRQINGKPHIFFDKRTDNSGIVNGLELPAPDKILSLQPSDTAPYSTFDISVEHPDFIGASFVSVPVFDGIESIQPARMLPKVEGISVPRRTVSTQPTDL